MSQLRLQGNVLSLSGVLDYRSVGALREQGRKALQQSSASALSIDCAQVEKSSSAGLALILALLRDAQQLNKSCRVENLPDSMQKIAQVSELMPILNKTY